MRVMVLVKASAESEAGVMPDTELLNEMGRFNEELVKAGVLLAGEGLHPSKKAVRIDFSGEERMVVDGPFAETKELVAGFWILQVKSMQDAIEWLKRSPFRDGQVEIRPIFELEDFGEAATAEVREREQHLRERIEGRN
ncbi:MAG: YciI family protein [Nitratireductor sp.]|uniref:YciI family protein n=1 Tax=Roseitalea porphyridii TaxID=1852022 RepID=UPI003283F0BC